MSNDDVTKCDITYSHIVNIIIKIFTSEIRRPYNSRNIFSFDTKPRTLNISIKQHPHKFSYANDENVFFFHCQCVQTLSIKNQLLFLVTSEFIELCQQNRNESNELGKHGILPSKHKPMPALLNSSDSSSHFFSFTFSEGTIFNQESSSFLFLHCCIIVFSFNFSRAEA